MADNLRVSKDAYDGFARGEVPAVLGVLAPDAKWTGAEGFPYGGTWMRTERSSIFDNTPIPRWFSSR